MRFNGTARADWRTQANRSPSDLFISDGADAPTHRVGSDRLLALAICSVVAGTFCAIEPSVRHWFVIPVTICGTLTCADALPWFRGKRDLFDPVAILAVFSVHFFFLAPLLHVYWDYWMPFVVPPPDWRPWLGWMAVLNLIGLSIYRAIIARGARDGRPDVRARRWEIDRFRFFGIATVLVVLTSLVQVWVYTVTGGVTGYMDVLRSGAEAFAGMGWVFILCESGPIIAMMLYVLSADRHPFLRRPVTIALALTGFLVLSLLFGGLRGSRSNTVWALFWAAGLVHYRIRPLSRTTAAIGMAGLLLFMYFYGFYKNVALEDVVRAIASREDRIDLEKKTGRTTEALVLADLGRSDVQAFELYRLTEGRDEYEYGWGRTYIGDLAIVIPAGLWPERPMTKVVEGTNLLYGPSSFRSGEMSASNVYGIVGELMLNFGPVVVPLGFIILGFVVRSVDVAMSRWLPGDARWLIAPLLVNFCFLVLVGDLDNLVFFSIRSLFWPALLLSVATRRRRVFGAPAAAVGEWPHRAA